MKDTVEADEIWPPCSGGGDEGVNVEVEHFARPEVLSVVVHDPADSTMRIMCTDLRVLP